MSKAPLHGIRVIDLSMGWAGPLAARHLADMGAQVIKVESCERFDWWRGWEATEEWIALNAAEQSAAFNTVNRNKLDVTLDLMTSDGKDLLKRLVAIADVVVENYSAGVLPKLGLGYDALKLVNPQLVMLSMPAFGSSGSVVGIPGIRFDRRACVWPAASERGSALATNDGARRIWRRRRRVERRRGIVDGAAPSAAHRRRSVCRPIASGRTVPARHSRNPRAIRYRARAGTDGQSIGGSRAAWRVSSTRR